MTLQESLFRCPVTLTEGAVIERLRRDPGIELDPAILHAGFVYQNAGRAALACLHGQYFEIGRASGLPMLSCTPTWRATFERAASAGLDGRVLNRDCCRFLAALRARLGPYSDSVFLGGLMGCRGDAYRPEEALTERDAESFHAAQACALAAGGVDFLFAATLPAASEALGIARAMAGCGLPFVISFIVRADGALLDGTPLHEMVARMDRDVRPAPLAYMANCVHPAVFRRALVHELRHAPRLSERLVGLQGNTSARDPVQLDNAPQLESEEPAVFAAAMLRLHREHRVQVLGGCCGTDDRHIAAIVELLQASERNC